jgi:two-component system sensor histidine kinase MtrB
VNQAAPDPEPPERGVVVARRRRPLDLWQRLGLRGRLTALFALGALLLSVSMGCLSYFTTQHFLVSDQINAVIAQADAAANTLQTDLLGGASSSDVPSILAQIDSASGSSSLLRYQGSTFSANAFAESSVQRFPPGLRSMVDAGVPAIQNIASNGSVETVVGIPLRAAHAQYYAVFNLGNLNHTLHVLALALALGGLITTLFGGLIGRLASAGTLRPLTAVSRAAVAIAGGDLTTRLAPVADDPDLGGLTASFNRMVDEVQERIERDARFASDVSHELRSPLTTLANSLNVLEAHADELSGRARQALSLLAADLRRFERMVGELLEISRSDTGAADVSLEDVAAGELVQRAVAASSRSLPESVRPPEVWIDPALAEARLLVDKRRFERVMANLLENAALYGGGATRVAAEPGPERAGRSTVVIAVEDHGPGVPEGERRKVFNRFYRGQASGRRGAGHGTGLGLALVAEHVRLIGGQVAVDDAPGGGARFTVELPTVDSEEEAPAEAAGRSSA